MKITDEQVEKVCEHVHGAWWYETDEFKAYARRKIRVALEAAFAGPQKFCISTLNCRLADGHEGGCVR